MGVCLGVLNIVLYFLIMQDKSKGNSDNSL